MTPRRKPEPVAVADLLTVPDSCPVAKKVGNVWLRLTRVAEHLGVATDAVLQMVEAGELRASRELGAKPAAWLIDGVSLEQFHQRKERDELARYSRDRHLSSARKEVRADLEFQRMLAYIDEPERVEQEAREIARSARRQEKLFGRMMEIIAKDDPGFSERMGLVG